MQLTKEDHKYRKEMFEVCPINEDPHFYYAKFFLQCAPEYNKLIELHKEDFLGRIVGALQAYDFKALANAEDKETTNITLKSITFSKNIFAPYEFTPENVDATLRLIAIGFYIWFRVAVENPTDLDIMMFFQAKDEDVHTNMTYSLDANTDWGKKQGYSYMDIETYFALYNTDIPKKQSFEYLIFLLVFAKGLWGMTAKENAKKAVEDINLLTAYAFNVFKGFKPQLQSEFREEYTLSDRDSLYERFFVSCFIFVACMEKINKEFDSHEGLEDYLASNND